MSRFRLLVAGHDQPVLVELRDSIKEIVALCRETAWAEHCWVHNKEGRLLRAYHLINGEWELSA